MFKQVEERSYQRRMRPGTASVEVFKGSEGDFDLEAAIKEKMQAKLGRAPEKTLGKLLETAKKFGIVYEEDVKQAMRVKVIGDKAVHDSFKCSSDESHQSLNITKRLLNKLYR